MFSGIIESLGKVVEIKESGSNFDFYIQCNFIDEVYIDQSIAHDGVCLTVVDINLTAKTYKVTAIKETLNLTSLKSWNINKLVNLERCLKVDARLDGHFVQGHVDMVTLCKDVETLDGSWYFTFDLPVEHKALVVNKGSIAVNGTSLTVILDDENHAFKVAIIPYTFEHTNFHSIKTGDLVNIEFDVLGKYVQRIMGKQ